MRNKRIQPPMPDKEPSATCPHFDAAIDEIEKAREANVQMREIIDQWRKQSDYWEMVAEDRSAQIEELEQDNESLSEKVRDLEKELSLL